MEFAGEEKRVQALFSEQLLEDQGLAPGFESVWTRAEKVGPAPVRASRRSLIAIVSALIIAGAALLGVRSWYRSNQTSTHQARNVSPQITLTQSPEVARLTTPEPSASSGGFKSHRERQKRFPRPRPIERTNTNEAALLSSWQSPTQLFMDAPAAVSFNSLPQLNQSVEELKLFLSRNSDLTKESNQ